MPREREKVHRTVTLLTAPGILPGKIHLRDCTHVALTQQRKRHSSQQATSTCSCCCQADLRATTNACHTAVLLSRLLAACLLSSRKHTQSRLSVVPCLLRQALARVVPVPGPKSGTAAALRCSVSRGGDFGGGTRRLARRGRRVESRGWLERPWLY